MLKKTPFFIGGYYRDRVQGYEVVEMSPRGMTIRYDDGTTQKLSPDSIAIKARIYDNMLSEFRINHPSTSDEYYWSLGYIAARGRFEAELPNQTVQNFLEQYQRLSGERVTREHPSVISLGDVDKWGPELRIYFPTPDRALHFGRDAETRSGQSDGIKRINNNLLWNKLVRLGFRLGREHSIEAIRDSIPHDKRQLFDEGRQGV